MIEAQDLRRRYGATVAVDGISFSVSAGEVFGFLGPNGAGKTTTIKMLTGQLRPTSGSGKVASFDIVSQRKELRQRIGVVFETQNLYEQISAQANLELFADIFRVPRSVVGDLLERMGLADRAREPVKKLSHGLRQRLLIARGLIAKPVVLFLDEPTIGLDPAAAQSLRGLVKELRSEGTTVFLTTHYMEEAEQVCDRVGIINAGRLVALGTPDELRHRHAAPGLIVEEEDGTRHTLDLQSPGTPAKVGELLGSGRVHRVWTEEPSLEEVFISLTGRRLT